MKKLGPVVLLSLVALFALISQGCVLVLTEAGVAGLAAAAAAAAAGATVAVPP